MQLVNLSNLPWVGKRMKRNQAIFHYLLQNGAFDSGLYVQPPIVCNLSGKQMWALPHAHLVTETLVGRAPVRVVQPVYTLPFTWRAPVRVLSASLIARSLWAGSSRSRPYALWMNSIDPLSVEIGARLAPAAATRVFDSSDDFVEFEAEGFRRERAAASLARTLKLVDKVLCVNGNVGDKLDHPNKRVFENCTVFENFQSVRPSWSLKPHFPKPAGSKYVGFAGGLNRMRVDMGLLRLLFERLPTCRFIFVGYTNDQSLLAELGRFPNTAFVPEVPYDELPMVIRSFDVAIVPHLDNENTRGNDLLKVLDYFACGVPVVSTRCSNVGRYAGACRIAESHEDFVEAVEGLISARLVHDPEPGLRIARKRDWSAQVPHLVPWVLDGMSGPDPR